MPVADDLLKMAMAHARRFLEASTARCSASPLQRANAVCAVWRYVTVSTAASTLRLRDLMDKASQVLAQGLPPAVPASYRALADHGEVPRSTLHARAQGRRSMEEKAESQQYLSPWEEDALVKFLLQMSDLGQPVRIKFIPFLAFCVARQRSEQA
jgi:hypothetical protein